MNANGMSRDLAKTGGKRKRDDQEDEEATIVEAAGVNEAAG